MSAATAAGITEAGCTFGDVLLQPELPHQVLLDPDAPDPGFHLLCRHSAAEAVAGLGQLGLPLCPECPLSGGLTASTEAVLPADPDSCSAALLSAFFFAVALFRRLTASSVRLQLLSVKQHTGK